MLFIEKIGELKIAVNTRLLLKDRLEGIGWFSFESLKRMVKQHPEHEFVFVFDRKYDPSFVFAPNVKAVVVPPQARHPFLYHIWFQFSIPYILKKYKIDLFLSPDGYIPLGKRVKTVSVMHDLNFMHYPKDLPAIETWYYTKFFPRFAKAADRIATVSVFSKMDIVEHFEIEEEKIDVVYNGVSELFQPLDQNAQKEIKNKFSDGCDYFVFVGALHPRKNLVHLFRAYEQFRENNSKVVKLLIVGAKKWWTESIKAEYDTMSFKDDVIFTGRVSSRDLADIMASALALTYVSYFEGFGIPILEAFSSNTAVITSNITSMPEVAKDAALLVDPFDPNDIADAMQRVVYDESFRASLCEKGLRRSKDFSWQQTSEKLWQSIEKVMND